MIVPDDVKIYTVTGTVDLRKGIDGYTAIIQVQLHMSSFKYLEYLFNTPAEKGMKDEVIESLLPYSKQLPSQLYVK